MKRMTALVGVLALGLVAARAQSDGALLDALVKKGVLSDQEAEDIRADETKDYSKTSASKLAIGDYVKKLQFYGDGRLRFDALSQHYNYQNGLGINDRERYRLRFGLIYNYSDNLSAGFELRSGTADDTANQSFGGSYTDASINVSKIYIQWKPADFATLIAGKFTNPIYTTTDEVWANDLTPEGGAETLSYTFPIGGGDSAPVTRDPKDTKSVAPAPSAPSDMSLTIGLIAAQYIYINQNEASGNVLGTSNTGSDVFTIENQIPITFKVSDDFTAKVVPGFTFYTGGGNTNYNGDVAYGENGAGTGPSAPSFAFGTPNSSSDPVFYSPVAFDDLNVVSAPGELDYNLFGQKLRTYWDFNWNVTAKERIQNVYLGQGGAFAPGGGAAGYGNFPAATPGGAAAAPTAADQAAIRKQNQNLSDGVAWAIGEQIGENKKKGDWSLLGEFRQVGLGALDPNTNGTDFANSYSNVQGVKVQGVYNFTDFLTLGVTYYNDWNYKGGLYSALGGPNGVNANKPAAGSTQYLVSQGSTQRVQVDLGWKF
jgi:hypothetical protein